MGADGFLLLHLSVAVAPAINNATMPLQIPSGHGLAMQQPAATFPNSIRATEHPLDTKSIGQFAKVTAPRLNSQRGGYRCALTQSLE